MLHLAQARRAQEPHNRSRQCLWSIAAGLMMSAGTGALAGPANDYLIAHSFRSAPTEPSTLVTQVSNSRTLDAGEQYLVDSGFVSDPSAVFAEQGEAVAEEGWVATSDPISEYRG